MVDEQEVVVEAPQEVRVTRRDMIEIERLGGRPFGDLFPDGKATAMGTLAMAYIQEKKADGQTSGFDAADFDTWLDEEVVVTEDDDEVEGENPT